MSHDLAYTVKNLPKTGKVDVEILAVQEGNHSFPTDIPVAFCVHDPEPNWLHLIFCPFNISQDMLPEITTSLCLGARFRTPLLYCSVVL